MTFCNPAGDKTTGGQCTPDRSAMAAGTVPGLARSKDSIASSHRPPPAAPIAACGLANSAGPGGHAVRYLPPGPKTQTGNPSANPLRRDAVPCAGEAWQPNNVSCPPSVTGGACCAGASRSTKPSTLRTAARQTAVMLLTCSEHAPHQTVRSLLGTTVCPNIDLTSRETFDFFALISITRTIALNHPSTGADRLRTK